jgi:hypothetical protein
VIKPGNNGDKISLKTGGAYAATPALWNVKRTILSLSDSGNPDAKPLRCRFDQILSFLKRFFIGLDIQLLASFPMESDCIECFGYCAHKSITDVST